jgi:hypothetical protein
MADEQRCDNCRFWTAHKSGQAGECSAMSNTEPGNVVRMILIRLNTETGDWQPNFDRNISVAVGTSPSFVCAMHQTDQTPVLDQAVQQA